jgi:hypothetical protein
MAVLNIIKKDLIPKYYVCELSKDKSVIVHENLLDSNFTKVRMDKRTIDLTESKFGNWHVHYYLGDRKWLCECSCGRLCAVIGYNLSSGRSTSCGHENYDDLTGKRFGDWQVLEYAGTEHGMTRWLCECSCGNKKEVYAKVLTNGRSKSCGHSTNAFNDLTGKQFGEWSVLEYEGDHYYKCQCSCGKIKSVAGYSLTRGDSLSCGHKSAACRKDTMMQRYGDTVPGKNREQWQIDILSSKEILEAYIIHKGYKPTAEELAKELGINKTNMYRNIHKYGIENLILIDYNSSKYEREIVELLNSWGICNIEVRDKKHVPGFELDIYIPDKKLAIEFNGSYWHSDLYKDKYYHQEKTIECAKRHIQLIHIFEYEWNDNDTKEKLINLLYTRLVNTKNYIGARETVVTFIDSSIAKEFCNKYHLHGYSNSSINIGCYYKSDLIGVLTFGKPRFNSNYQYELIRLCWKDDIKVHGGLEKMFTLFIKSYNVNNIISYCDISKFNGNAYLRLGFTVQNISEPNYIWYNLSKKTKLTRYKTQKHKLVEAGFGDANSTESDIMEDLDYVKIHDSGNLVLEWRNQNGSQSTNNME